MMDSLVTQLAELEASQLIRMVAERELAYLFKHVLTQETVYQSLLLKTRREIHLRVADSCENLYAGELDAFAAVLSHHYFEAGAPNKSFKYALRAGLGAAQLYAHSEALMFYERALAALAQLQSSPAADAPENAEIQRLYASRGRTFELTSRYDLAEQNYLEMEAAAHTQGNRALELAAMTLRAPLYSTYTPLFDPAKAQALNSAALELAREIGDRAAEAKILWILMLWSNYSGGDPRAAIEHGARSLALARELGLREQVAYTLNDLGFTFGILGYARQERATLQEAVQLWQELGNLPMLADAMVNLGGVEAYAGNYAASLGAQAEAFRLSQITGSLWGQAYSRMFLGNLYTAQGEFGKAFEVMEECFRVAEQANFAPPQVITRMDYAWALGALGLLDRALVEGQRAFQVMAEAIPSFAPFVAPQLVRLYLRAGNRAAAEELREGPLGLESDSPWKNAAPSRAPKALAEAELAMTDGDYAQALTRLNLVSESLKRHHVRAYLPEVLYVTSEALIAQGDADGAWRALAEARELADQLNARWMLWQILARQSELETERGDHVAARVHREAARAVAQYIADHIALAEHRQAFLELAPVRRVLDRERLD